MRRFFAGAVLVHLGLSASPLIHAEQSGGAVVSGTLTSAGAGAPVRKAQVRLVGTTAKLTISAVTDAAGTFTFPNVPAGEYMLKAWKTGYLDMVLGAPRPGRNMPGTRLTVSARQKLDALVALSRSF